MITLKNTRGPLPRAAGGICMLVRADFSYNALREKENNTLGKRIRAARVKKGLRQRELTQLLQSVGVTVTPAAYSKWELGETTPNPYQLFGLCRCLDITDPIPYFTGSSASRYPELSAAGERMVEEFAAILADSGRYAPVGSRTVRRVDVRIYDLPVSAGPGEFLDAEDSEVLSLAASTVPTGTDFALRISGDSMEPRYHNGQMVFVERRETLDPGEVGIFVYDGRGFLKMLDYVEEEGAIRPALCSFNPAYPPIPVNPELELRVVGRVLS